MTISIAALTGNERKPGDFHRHPTTGAPYVNHPTELTTNGRPKRVMYGRPSGFGESLDNPYNLLKWKERELVRGIALADPVWRTINLESREQLDQLVNDAYDAAESGLAADRGTHIHLLCETHDRQNDFGDLYNRGVELGIAVELQQHVVTQWVAFRVALGVTAVAVEATVVHDGWRLAGTLDRLEQTSRKLVTNLGTIPKGATFIGDIKTGSLTVDNDGTPKYWIKYPVQLAAYADAVPYDTDTDTRGTWDVPPHRKIALIYHYDLARALDGEPVEWQAIPVSLATGRIGGQAVLAVKEFGRRRDLFGDPIEIADAGSSSPTPAPNSKEVSCPTTSKPPSTSSSTASPTSGTPQTPTTRNATTRGTNTSRTSTRHTNTTGSPSTTTSTSTPSHTAALHGSTSSDPTEFTVTSLALANAMLEWPEKVRAELKEWWPVLTPTPDEVRHGAVWTEAQIDHIERMCDLADAPFWQTTEPPQSRFATK